MRLLIYIGHPAHFHLFKNVIYNLKNKGHDVLITSKNKDILDKLLAEEGLKHHNILVEGRKDDKFSIFMGMIKRDFRLFKYIRTTKPQLLIGTSVENSHLGKLFKIPVINVSEDDADVVPLYVRLSYPGASVVLSPDVCDNGKWERKSVKYAGYHELSYLHPNHFKPEKSIVEKYFSADEPYFLIRFAKLTAHHDTGAKGISRELAAKIVEILRPYGRVYITSERELEEEFEPCRMNINPLDIHHVMAFAKLYIGDSQTMAAEAGVLGTPFLRFNDFVGKLGYLNELEDKYELGYGIKTENPDILLSQIKELVNIENSGEIFQARRVKMLNEKIDVAQFLTWFIDEYPDSLQKMKDEPEYQFKFK